MSHYVVHQESHDQEIQENQLEAQLRHVVAKLKTLTGAPLAREEHCSLLQNFEQLVEVKVQQRSNYQG